MRGEHSQRSLAGFSPPDASDWSSFGDPAYTKIMQQDHNYRLASSPGLPLYNLHNMCDKKLILRKGA